MEGQMKQLTVTNYGSFDKEEEKEPTVKKTRVTIAPHHVHFVIASDDTYCIVDGIELRKVNVILTEGNNLELIISLLDLSEIENAIGSYMVP